VCEICDEKGQRAFVGKVNMDMNMIEPLYKEETEESLMETEKYVKEVLEKYSKNGLVYPIITPRLKLK
jgi:guanine deaminase